MMQQPLPLTESPPQEAPTGIINDESNNAKSNGAETDKKQSWLPLNPEVQTDAAPNGDGKAAESNTAAPESTEPGAATATPSDTKKDVPPKSYTVKEVSTHNKTGNIWIIIDNEVYDVSKFQHEHPGGAKVMSGVAGKDATKKFDKYHRRALLDRYKADLRVGVLEFPEAMTNSRRSFFQKVGLSKIKG